MGVMSLLSPIHHSESDKDTNKQQYQLTQNIIVDYEINWAELLHQEGEASRHGELNHGGEGRGGVDLNTTHVCFLICAQCF